MVYGQALKFIHTQVFAILEDQTVLRGRLTRVDKDGHAIIKSEKPNSTLHRVHLRYIFPQK